MPFYFRYQSGPFILLQIAPPHVNGEAAFFAKTPSTPDTKTEKNSPILSFTAKKSRYSITGLCASPEIKSWKRDDQERRRGTRSADIGLIRLLNVGT